MGVKDKVWCKERRKMDETSSVCFVDHVALRHPRTGSVMIEAMSAVFKQYGNKWHIADFFTKVSKFQGSTCSFCPDGNGSCWERFQEKVDFSHEDLRDTEKLLGNDGLIMSFDDGGIQRSWLSQLLREMGIDTFCSLAIRVHRVWGELSSSCLLCSHPCSQALAWLHSPRGGNLRTSSKTDSSSHLSPQFVAHSTHLLNECLCAQ